MSEKYIDLAELITDEIGGYQTEHSVTLNWLDRLAAEHPGQVPGRTITASDRDSRTALLSPTEKFGWIKGFEDAGGRVVPDPEPTNAEKMLEDLSKWTGRLDTCIELGLPQFLVDNGWTKAPGGGDDH